MLAKKQRKFRRTWRFISRPVPAWQCCDEAENVSKGYGERLLFDNLSFKLPPGGIVGVIGPNGAGKRLSLK